MWATPLGLAQSTIKAFDTQCNPVQKAASCNGRNNLKELE